MILVILLILLIFIFQKSIDPFLAQLIKEDDLDEIVNGNSDEILLKRVKKSKIVLILLLFWGFLDYSLTYFIIVFLLFLFFLKGSIQFND